MGWRAQEEGTSKQDKVSQEGVRIGLNPGPLPHNRAVVRARIGNSCWACLGLVENPLSAGLHPLSRPGTIRPSAVVRVPERTDRGAAKRAFIRQQPVGDGESKLRDREGLPACVRPAWGVRNRWGVGKQ